MNVRHVMRSCMLKRRYSTRTKAGQARKKVQNRLHNYSMRIYYCENCDGYHLTKRSK